MFNLQPYLDKELPILPVRAKAPGVNKGESWQTIDFLQYHQEYKWEGAGLILGERSGVIKLDIDTEDKEIQKKIRKLIPLDWIFSGCTGNKKRMESVFFKYEGNTKKKLENINVELLGEGQYCVLPESPYYDNTDKSKPPFKTDYFYKWIGKPLSEIDLDDLPYLPKDLWEKLEQLDKEYAGVNLKLIKNGEKLKGPGRNPVLTSQASAALNKNKDLHVIAQELLEYDKTHHEIPLFSDPHDSQMKNDPYTNAFAFVCSQAASHYRRKGNPRVEVTEPIIALDKKKEKQEIKMQKYPELRGYAKKIFDYVYGTARTPRRDWAMASALSTVSTVMGNRFVHNGMRPNIMPLLLGDSGGGKEHPMNAPKKILIKSGNENYVGDGQLASAAAIVTNLTDQHQIVRLNTIDEADHFIRGLGKDSPNTRGMAQIISQLYTHHEGEFMGITSVNASNDKNIKNGQRGRCREPYINFIMGTNVPSFRDSVNVGMMEQGIAARFLYFPTTGPAPSNIVDKDLLTIPRDIISWVNRTIDKQHLMPGFIQPHDMEFASKSAKLHYYEMFRYVDNIKIKEHKNEKSKAIANRINEFLIKFFIMDTWSQENKSITIDNLDWSLKFLKVYYENTKKFLETTLFYSQEEKNSVQIQQVVMEAGIKGITKSGLLRNKTVRKMKPVEREKAIEDLITMEAIFVTQKGKKQTFYHQDYIVKPHG